MSEAERKDDFSEDSDRAHERKMASKKQDGNPSDVGPGITEEYESV